MRSSPEQYLIRKDTKMSIEHPEHSTSPAAAVTGAGARPNTIDLGDDAPVSVDKSLLRLGATLGALGVVMQIVMDRLHPHAVDPDNSTAVFRDIALAVFLVGAFISTWRLSAAR